MDAIGTAAPRRKTTIHRSNHMQVLVFGAPWCASCKVLKKQMEGQTFPGFEIIHVDMDAQPEMANYHHVKSLPTIVIPEKKVLRTGITTAKQFTDLLASI
jgi:thioredoxin-like negative regulator of GroEL